MIRFGLVGVGPWAQRYVATIARRADARIDLFARSSKADDVTIAGATRVGDWQTLLARAGGGELDAVIVATTPENQAEVAHAAVRAGVPAVVEQPLGLSRAAAERVLEAVRASNDAPPLAVNYVHLYTPAHRKLSALVRAAGGPAAIVTIESEGTNRGPFRRFSSLYDYGPHDLSLCLDLVGSESPHRIESARRLASDTEGEIFEAALVFGDTRVAFRVGNGASTKTRRFTLALKDGRTFTNDNLAPPESTLTENGKPIPLDSALPLDVMLSEFIARVERWRNGARRHTDEVRNAEFSVRVNEILDAVAVAASHQN
jgi:predicted dehydrogenase